MARPAQSEFQSFFLRVDRMAELRGAGVGYLGDGACEVVRLPQHGSGLSTFVILQEDELRSGAAQTPAAVPPPDIGVELVGLGLNCAGAVLSWAAFFGETAAVPLTGGGSTALMWVTVPAGVATVLQCANSIVRTFDATANGGQWIQWLDSKDFYVWAGEGLDAMSLLGAAAAGAMTVRAVKAIRQVSNRSFADILRGMSRAERKRLAKELIRMQKPGISNGAMKGLIRAGSFPSRFASAEVSKALFDQLRDAISATLAFAGSAASGDLKLLYVHIYQE
jgi:hypothetical protein